MLAAVATPALTPDRSAGFVPGLAVHWRDMLVPDLPVVEILVRGSLMYLALFALLRVVLKRHSAGLGISDLLVVVLIADAAQNGMAGGYHSVPDGVLLVAVLVGWAWLLDWLGYRFPVLQRMVKPPKLPLVRDGRLLEENMRRELLTREELHSQLREQGIDNIGQIRRAYMEPDGRVSVLARRGAPAGPSATGAPEVSGVMGSGTSPSPGGASVAEASPPPGPFALPTRGTDVDTMSLPGLENVDTSALIERLQDRLTALTDLHLTLKHVHWNVVGPNFIGVHEMLDPQVDAVREMTDKTAERIAALGGEPMGLLGPLATSRRWDDYPLNRATTSAHLAALDLVFDGVIRDHRRGIDEFDRLDPVSQDMLIDQTKQLEMFQWFVRAHLEDAGGRIRHGAMRNDNGGGVARDERVVGE